MSDEKEQDAADPSDRQGTFPTDQVANLRSKSSELGAELPAPASISSIETGNHTDIVTNVRLLGIFPTVEWKSDPTMPDFVGYHKHRIGYYNVAECDITDAAGTKTRLVLVINAGDGDCNTGYWGAAFESKGANRVVARFRSVGDTETATEEEGGGIQGFVPYNEKSEGEGGLHFPLFKEDEDEDEDEEERVAYFSGLWPGMCGTQLEKLLGIVMGRLMQGREWRALPKPLKNYGNR